MIVDSQLIIIYEDISRSQQYLHHIVQVKVKKILLTKKTCTLIVDDMIKYV